MRVGGVAVPEVERSRNPLLATTIVGRALSLYVGRICGDRAAVTAQQPEPAQGVEHLVAPASRMAVHGRPQRAVAQGQRRTAAAVGRATAAPPAAGAVGIAEGAGDRLGAHADAPAVLARRTFSTSR